MVAPKQHALKCDDCHSRKGRLAGLKGFYMPGRDRNVPLDLYRVVSFGSNIGWLRSSRYTQDCQA